MSSIWILKTYLCRRTQKILGKYLGFDPLTMVWRSPHPSRSTPHTLRKRLETVRNTKFLVTGVCYKQIRLSCKMWLTLFKMALKRSISKNMRQNYPQTAPPGTPKGDPNLSKIVTKSSQSRFDSGDPSAIKMSQTDESGHFTPPSDICDIVMISRSQIPISLLNGGGDFFIQRN